VKSDGRERSRLPPWLESELVGLDQQYTVTYDAADRTVVVADVAVPQGYTPRRVTVRLTLPAGYPQAAPRAELPWDLRYQGRVPRHLLASGQWLVRGYLGDPVIFFPAAWDQSDSLRTVVDAVLDDLAAGTESHESEGCDA
jgi:hypothetical protein